MCSNEFFISTDGGIVYRGHEMELTPSSNRTAMPQRVTLEFAGVFLQQDRGGPEHVELCIVEPGEGQPWQPGEKWTCTRASVEKIYRPYRPGA